VKGYLAATFASLRIRSFRLYFIGQSISITGTWMQKLAQAWLVLELTNSGAWLGIALAIQMLPTLFLTPWGGVLADRFSKRTILICTATASIIPSVLLGVLTLTSVINVPIVLGLALLGGIIDAFEKPARQSFPSEIVERGQLTNAVMLNNVSPRQRRHSARAGPQPVGGPTGTNPGRGRRRGTDRTRCNDRPR
jgi:MFS family permease